MKHDTAELADRVNQFNQLALPGQMPMMHMGTSYLVSDLLAAVKERNVALRIQQIAIQAYVDGDLYTQGLEAILEDIDNTPDWILERLEEDEE